jgi:HNH endonuclease
MGLSHFCLLGGIMYAKNTISHVRIKELLDYDPATGIFTWRVRKANRLAKGTTAGSVWNNRIRIKIDGHSYLAHRLAWFLVYQEWPKQDVDHINGNSLDNRLCNLRDVSRAVNVRNVASARNSSRTRLLGASPHKNKYQSSIMIDGVRRYLGLFDTPEAANEAYVKAKRAACPYAP